MRPASFRAARSRTSRWGGRRSPAATLVGDAHRAEQVLAELRDTAADDEQLGVEHGLESAARLAERGGDAAQRLGAPGSPASTSRETAGPLIEPFSARRAASAAPMPPRIGDRVGLALQRATGGVLLEASVLTAAARQALADEADVAELGGDAVAAAEERAVEHDGPADAGAHREHDHVVDVAAGAEAELRPAGGVRVVLDGDGHVDAAPRASPSAARCATRCSARG